MVELINKSILAVALNSLWGATTIWQNPKVLYTLQGLRQIIYPYRRATQWLARARCNFEKIQHTHREIQSVVFVYYEPTNKEANGGIRAILGSKSDFISGFNYWITPTLQRKGSKKWRSQHHSAITRQKSK